MFFGGDDMAGTPHRYSNSLVIRRIGMCQTIGEKLRKNEELDMEERVFVIHAMSFMTGYMAREAEPMEFVKTPTPPTKPQPHHTPPPTNRYSTPPPSSSGPPPSPKTPNPKPTGNNE